MGQGGHCQPGVGLWELPEPQGELLESQHQGQNGCVRSPESPGLKDRDRVTEATPTVLPQGER